MADGENYTLTVATTEDEERILEFLRRYFFIDEPLNIAVDLLQGGERCTELEDFCVEALDEGTSLMALAADGSVVGACLNETKLREQCGDEKDASPLPPPVGLPNTKHRDITRLLDHNEEAADVFGRYPDVNSYLDIKILSVDPAFRGRGMATKMMDRTEELAKRRGIPLVFCVASSHFTALAVERLGFEQIHELPYKDFVDDEGRVLFSPPAPHLKVKTYVKHI